MGLATRSRSPSIDTKSEAEDISSDEGETTGLLVDHEEVTSSSAEAVVPLQLPGQTDIRRFFKAFDRFKSDEEAAFAMGLSLGMVGETDDWPKEVEIVEEAFDMLRAEDQYKAEEEAAAALGLSCGIDGDMEYFPEDLEGILMEEERLEKIETDAAEVMAVIFENCLDKYKVEEEAASFLGLSLGIHEDVEDRPEEQLDILDERELEDPYQEEEDAAIAMGLCLALGAGRTVEATFSSPATPPNRSLAAKSSMEIEPIQASKRRRLLEEVVVDASKGQHFVRFAEPEAARPVLA